MIVHGTLVLLWGLLAGFPFLRAIVTQAPPRKVEAWRAAHTGLSGTGVMLVALGGVVLHWQAQGTAALIASVGLVLGAYGIAVAMTLAAITGARGLAAGGGAANWIVWAAYMTGVPATLAGTAAFLWLALQHAGAVS